MMKTGSDYDVLVIGAGQAGIPLARKLADDGRRVAIAERKHLGGSCVNFGCTPTKAVVASARIAHLARRAADFGIELPSPTIDFAKLLGRARRIVEESKASLAKGLDECRADVLRGPARFVGREGDIFTIEAAGRVVRANQVVINTGTRTCLPPIQGLSDVPYLHAGNWLHGQSVPEHLVIVGAGYIALEMSQFYRRIGSQVTVIAPGTQVVEREDADIAAALEEILADEGIAFRLGTRVTAVAREAAGVRIHVESETGADSLTGSHLFIATGRRPNTDDLGVETIGLPLAKDGTVEVDERLASSVPGVWAAGDVRGGPMFTNSSWDDHRILESQLLGDGSHTTAGRIVPYAIFTDPELGRVGMTESQAREKFGSHVKVATFPMKQNGKATELGETLGFIKLIADVRDGHLLGAAVLASEGAELVASYVTLMNARIPLSAICKGVYIHPTLAEAVQSAAMALKLPS